MDKHKPIKFSELKAESGEWPPRFMYCITPGKPGLVMLVQSEANAENKIAIEMCSHGAITFAVKILESLSKTPGAIKDASHTLGIAVASTILMGICDHLPSCEGEPTVQSPVDPKKVN